MEQVILNNKNILDASVIHYKYNSNQKNNVADDDTPETISEFNPSF